MEVEGEAAGGRAAVAHVDCCVLCVVCFVLWCERPFSYRQNPTYFVESQYRISQNGRPLRTSRQKCTMQLSSFVDFGKFLTVDMAWCGPLEECATNELLFN